VGKRDREIEIEIEREREVRRSRGQVEGSRYIEREREVRHRSFGHSRVL
jgi:hypothetical protein